VKQLLVFLLVWLGPAILVLLIGAWAIFRGRMRRALGMPSPEQQPTETNSDRKAA
jgi:cytochrome c-type biogenesis protein CcmH/NrfF